MQRYASLLFLICLVAVTGGCATTDDLRRVRGEMDRQIQLTNDRIGVLEQEGAARREETALLRKEIEKSNAAIASLRGLQAERRADATELREQLQQMRGAADLLRRDLAAASAKMGSREGDEKALRDRLDNLTFKVNFLENFLGIGRKEEAAEPPDRGPRPAPGAPAAAAPAKTDRDSLYAAAYQLFKEGKYERSRESFEHFLKLHPDSEVSDNAQFWIGECFYFEKKYERAIVEYEKVLKNYPAGNKIPYAILKQGFSFQMLGDKESARLLLQQVIKDYPNTNEARIARAKLQEIKK